MLDNIVFELSVIVVGAAALGTLFLFAKQPILAAYIAAGFVAGPNGLGFFGNTDHIREISQLGVILLLFLVGLNLQPEKLAGLFRETSLLTAGCSISFGAVSFVFAKLLGFDTGASLVSGAAMMFSSTVVALKLIPTTSLHHKRTGELMISVLLLQDILAILVIIFISGGKSDAPVATTIALLTARLALLFASAFLGVRYVMTPLLSRFDTVQEYTFVATLGWCLLWAECAHGLGLSYEIGAFAAGLSIASCRVAVVIAEHLKPLREFFLILFFFAVGAELDLNLPLPALLAAVGFGAALVPFKARVFSFAFLRSGETPELSRELAVRLAQASEFSLLVVFAASSSGLLRANEAMVIQIATIVTLVVSTYWVVLRYPTPISNDEALRLD